MVLNFSCDQANIVVISATSDTKKNSFGKGGRGEESLIFEYGKKNRKAFGIKLKPLF